MPTLQVVIDRDLRTDAAKQSYITTIPNGELIKCARIVGYHLSAAADVTFSIFAPYTGVSVENTGAAPQFNVNKFRLSAAADQGFVATNWHMRVLEPSAAAFTVTTSASVTGVILIEYETTRHF